MLQNLLYNIKKTSNRKIEWLFLYFEVFKSHFFIPQDIQYLTWSYVVFTLIEVSESGFINLNEIRSIMTTQKYVFLLMHFRKNANSMRYDRGTS